MLQIDVAWAEQQDLNYLLEVMNEINRDEEDNKPRRLTNSELMSVMVE